MPAAAADGATFVAAALARGTLGTPADDAAVLAAAVLAGAVGTAGAAGTAAPGSVAVTLLGAMASGDAAAEVGPAWPLAAPKAAVGAAAVDASNGGTAADAARSIAGGPAGVTGALVLALAVAAGAAASAPATSATSATARAAPSIPNAAPTMPTAPPAAASPAGAGAAGDVESTGADALDVVDAAGDAAGVGAAPSFESFDKVASACSGTWAAEVPATACVSLRWTLVAGRAASAERGRATAAPLAGTPGNAGSETAVPLAIAACAGCGCACDSLGVVADEAAAAPASATFSHGATELRMSPAAGDALVIACESTAAAGCCAACLPSSPADAIGVRSATPLFDVAACAANAVCAANGDAFMTRGEAADRGCSFEAEAAALAESRFDDGVSAAPGAGPCGAATACSIASPESVAESAACFSSMASDVAADANFVAATGCSGSMPTGAGAAATGTTAVAGLLGEATADGAFCSTELPACVPASAAGIVPWTTTPAVTAATAGAAAMSARSRWGPFVADDAGSSDTPASLTWATDVLSSMSWAGSTAAAAAAVSTGAIPLAQPVMSAAAASVTGSAATMPPTPTPTPTEATPTARAAAYSAGAAASATEGLAAAIAAAVGTFDPAVSASQSGDVVDAVGARAVSSAAPASVAPASAVHRAALASIERSVSCTLGAGAMRSAGFSVHA
ncbi:hypothetical protein [Burkholderia sp. ABCPW 111]|uniref:hypothetical protein n=1 Tax=Burkholderia sp. ABCPW 111 TaxID=1820025 RepID=UPI003FA4B1B5